MTILSKCSETVLNRYFPTISETNKEKFAEYDVCFCHTCETVLLVPNDTNNNCLITADRAMNNADYQNDGGLRCCAKPDYHTYPMMDWS